MCQWGTGALRFVCFSFSSFSPAIYFSFRIKHLHAHIDRHMHTPTHAHTHAQCSSIVKTKKKIVVAARARLVFRTLWFLRSNYDSYNRPPCLSPSPSPLSLSRYCFYSPVGSLHVRGEVREGVGSAPCAIAMARRSLNKAHLLPLHVARCLLSICNGGCHFSSIADPTLCHYPLPLAPLS